MVMQGAPAAVTKAPTFTIIVAVYNGARTLHRCLASLAGQTRRPQVIVIDGGSTDGTVEILEQNDARIDHWISERDAGVYDAWNKALPHIRGDWVLFLGADDELARPTVLEEAATFLENLPAEVAIAYGDVDYVDSAGRWLHRGGGAWADEQQRFLDAVMRLPHSAMFHRSTVFVTARFDPAFRISGDYDLLLGILPQQPPVYLQGLLVTRMQIGGLSYDVRNRLKALREALRSRRSHGGRGLPLAWCRSYAYNSLLLWRERFRRLSGRAPV